MKFSVPSSTLLKQLQIASGAIGSNPVLPILEDFLFTFPKKTPETEALSEKMMNAWISFAKTGNPNHTKIPE